MPLIVIATANPHKVQELRALLLVPGVEFLGLDEAARLAGVVLIEPAETGTTFEANATIKAESYAAQLGLVCLADDSGLEIDALGGRPGVISSHYCTDGRAAGMSRAERDAANNERVLRELGGVPPEARAARFVCVMCLAGCSGGAFGGAFGGARRSRVPSASGALGQGFGGADVPSASGTPHSHLFPPITGFTTHHRRLPHWQSPGAVYFVTFRLHTGELAAAERDLVVSACLHWHRQRMQLTALVVMPDHVHMLFKPLPRDTGYWAVPELVKSIKRFSAGTINIARGTFGQVWQDEYFDRIVRDGAEYDEKFGYIVDNPVRRGLVSNPSHYRWLRLPEREELVRAIEKRHEHWATVEAADGTSAPPEARFAADGTSAPPEARFAADGTSAPPEARVGILAIVRGTFEGRIGLPPRVPAGANGFGYDPLFLVAPDFTRTGAELPADEKNRISHRAAAARLMLTRLREMMSTSHPSP